ncbi:Acyl-CoA dehydrogenase/oxidase, N-terminal and middle domain [Pseudocohnilembus persalinus]|uniref:Acyl-CoA dehydrogenase/oxidase, N-terminal and middle domain n=1 Tax=Pseudocohnilembus persalinus TaxID=266149 RepID=A0A0V0R8X3_PSEPJ|nr:Acyl-CoA dehydrogenase/oxidase, N-terminal and middle domain [Pseudocohnilembus persalinus]|eukprot:KRX10929.1 Acyl-CoA dehydrogenase/oxidase, N-terminal and middle domain [Pseudocohnilembus persalinus]
MSQKFNTSEYLDYLRNLHQEGPHLGNQYLEDQALQDYIKDFVPEKILKTVETQKKGLIELGQAAAGPLQAAADDCELTPPRLQLADAFGKKNNQLAVGWGWKEQKQFAARFHVVGSAYVEGQGLEPYQRFLQSVRMFLYHPSSGMFGCPLAMTDGCAYVLSNLLKDPNLNQKVRQKVQKTFNHLTSNDPQQFWTSGQWMTEKRGGSDVGATTETIAIQYKENKFKLFGYKFFTSAADSEVTLALARIIDPNQNYSQDQIRKLPISMFLIKTHKKNGELNGIEYQSLKEKLGTRQVPTAELILNGAKATLLSPPGKGVKYIANMLQTTRLYNAATSVGFMRRVIAVCRDYCDRRSVFGKKLNNHPMQIKLLSDMEVTYRGNLIFFLKSSQLFSKVQAGVATQDEQNLQRIGSPLLKLFTAKELQFISSEGMEILGGIGYLENSKLPVLFRDGQVLPIWEGTTHVMAHDFHRAITQKNNPISSYSKYITQILVDNHGSRSKMEENSRAKEAIKITTLAYNQLIADINEIINNKTIYQKKYEYFMRDICFGASRIFSAVLLLEHYIKSGKQQDLEIFIRWVNIKPLYCPEKNMDLEQNCNLALDRQADGKLGGTGNFDPLGNPRPKF